MLEVKSSTPFGKYNMQVEAACQVAHPISTHKVDMEMDFYTAVDDLNPEEETGAGMMGVVGFNSACLLPLCARGPRSARPESCA